MIDRLDRMMQFQQTALSLRSQRQELLAANIANSDTPGYKAVDFDFAAALKAATEARSAGSAAAPSPQILYRIPTQSSLDGNSVEMDNERAQFADNSVRQEAAMQFLTGQIKKMLAAIGS
ncbi:MAG: flagellar basal body rod protein FlgB [Burkholderiales bacterium]